MTELIKIRGLITIQKEIYILLKLLNSALALSISAI
jgi:hypothetical protein